MTRAAAVGTALVLGVAYTLSIFDLPFLSGAGPYWSHLQLWDLDRAQALIGWRYFAHDVWRFPLFWVPDLGYPEGASIVYTDSIPLLALLAKSWLAVTGVAIGNYLGAWLGACYVLQGVAAALLVVAMGVRNRIAIVAAVLIALSAPILLRRFGHGALCAHFLILLMLAGYFRLVRLPASAPAWTLVVVAPAASLLVTSYLGVMLAAIGVAAALEARRRRLLGSSGAAAVGFAIPLAAVVTLYVAGMIGTNAPAPQGSGYGHFSMNLLSPVLGDGASYMQRVFGPISTDATGGQYEGYNYLGIGILTLATLCFLSRPTEILAATRRHAFLTTALGLMSVYALGDTVYAGDRALLHLTPPEGFLRIASIFRSSGRFFWPTYYLVTFWAIVAATRRVRGVPLGALLVVTVVAQLAETHPLRADLARASTQVNRAVFTTDDMLAMAAKAQRIFAFPSFECATDDAGWPRPNSWRGGLAELTLAVSSRAVPINSAYVSRGHKNCDGERRQFEREPEVGTLYVVRRADAPDFPTRFAAPDACLRTDLAFTCLLATERPE